MDINRNNYEAFLLDMLEGRLTAEEKQDVRDFLKLNPDLDPDGGTDLNENNIWTLENNRIQFPWKGELKKEFPNGDSQLTRENFDLFSIARLEGDLTGQQEDAHDAMWAGDEQLKSQWTLWQQSRLKADPITFANKEQLKRKQGNRSRVIWISAISSAAAVALIFILLGINVNVKDIELTEQTEQSEQTIQSVQTDQIIRAEQSELTEYSEQTEQIELDEQAYLAEQTEQIRMADHPATLSIRKHQEPPELHGKKENASGSVEVSDSVRRVKQQTQPRPIRTAFLNQQQLENFDRGHYDKIGHLEIPATSVHYSSLSIAQLADLEIQEIVENYAEQSDFSIWTIASAGINGINRITGGEMSLLASRDEDGDVSGLRFKSRLFSVDRPLQPRE